ncbi:MAG: hypothetical protein KA987_09585 [Saprospiraceae bacterium]|nr:hypothetical protein [Saprospiraceae bacterium]
MNSNLKKNQFHVYDIELTALTNKVNNALEIDSLWNEVGIQAKDYYLSFAADLEEYCTSETVDTSSPNIVISPNSNMYSPFLAYQICFMDTARIPLFLDYQRNFFEGNHYAPKDNFIGLVEFFVFTQVKNRSLTKTEKRLEMILNWVRSVKNGFTQKNEIKTLKWIGEPSELKKLSELVSDDGYTVTSVTFRNVFTDKVACKWKKEPNTLAFLIHRLYHEGKIEIDQSGKGYLKAAQNYFSDFSKGRLSQIILKDRIHEVISKYAEKNQKNRERVENWLDSALEKTEKLT